MGLKTSLILAIIFIVLGSFAFFDPLGHERAKEEKEEREGKVFWLKDKLATKLRVRTKDLDVVMECAKPTGCPFDPTGDWKLTAPIEDRADPATAGSLAGSLLNLTVNEKIPLEDGVDPKEFGFDPPAAEVEAWVAGENEPYNLKIGTAKPVGPAAYVQTNRDPNAVFMVGNYFPPMVQKDLFHWRNKRIFPEVTGDQIQAIEWEPAKGQKILAEKSGSEWMLKNPDLPANATALEGLTSTLVYLDMKGVFSESRSSPEARKILAGKPEWSLGFRTQPKGEAGSQPKGEAGSQAAGENWQRIKLYASGKKGGKEYVVEKPGENRLLLVEGLPIERFRKPLIEFRERHLIVGDELSGATEIALRFPREKKEIVMKPEKDSWVYLSGEKPAEPLSRDRIDSFFRTLSAVEAESFVKAAQSKDPVIALFDQRPADLEIDFRAGQQVKRSMRFTVHERNAILTAGRLPGELALVKGSFLKLLPVRFTDLYESTNKQVPELKKEEADGEHSHAGHNH